MRLVELCAATGVDEVEVTSFVSPKWVPQLGDAGEVITEFAERCLAGEAHVPGMLSVLIPNKQGLETLGKVERSIGFDGERLLPPMIGKISLFAAASETFSRKNTNGSIDEVLGRFRELLSLERRATAVRGYISCVVACPFEGPIAPGKVADVAARMVDLGVTEIDLGDTIGAGTPETIARVIEAVGDRIGWLDNYRTTLHLHDTFGRASECVKVALQLGVRSFDSSVAGLGGCPYASTPGRRAPGNISTEVLVQTIHGAGFSTGVSEQKLAVAAAYAREIVGRSRAVRERAGQAAKD